MKAEDTVDHAVGFSALVKIGEHVPPGGVIAVVHANDEVRLAEACARLEGAVRIGDASPTGELLIAERVG